MVCLLEAVRQRGDTGRNTSDARNTITSDARNTITNTSYTDGGPNTISNTSPLLRDLMLPAVVSAPPSQSPITLPEGGGREEGAISLLGREEGALQEALQVIARDSTGFNPTTRAPRLFLCPTNVSRAPSLHLTSFTT